MVTVNIQAVKDIVPFLDDDVLYISTTTFSDKVKIGTESLNASVLLGVYKDRSGKCTTLMYEGDVETIPLYFLRLPSGPKNGFNLSSLLEVNRELYTPGNLERLIEDVRGSTYKRILEFINQL